MLRYGTQIFFRTDPPLTPLYYVPITTRYLSYCGKKICVTRLIETQKIEARELQSQN